MSAEGLVLTWLPELGGLVLKSLVVFLVAGVTLFALRQASASARHLVCLLTLTAMLALPVLSLALPGWRLAVLAPAQSGKEPTPRQVAAPPGAGGRGVLDAGNAGAASSTPPHPVLAPFVLNSSSSRNVRTPVSGANKEVGSSSWPLLLAALWLGGVLLAALRPLLGLWGIARLSQTSAVVADAPTLAVASECVSALGLSRTPAMRQAAAPVPMTWGWRSPVVVLPMDAQRWPEDRLRAVLLHEMAHVRRRDWLSHRFADVVCALYWFHPLVWLTARRLRAESEIACDDLVLTSGIAAPDYAKHLLDVARALRPISALVPTAAIAMARTAGIEGRLTMILDTTRSRRALTRRALLLVLSLSAAALVPLAVLRPAARAQATLHRMPSRSASGTAKGLTLQFKSLTFKGSSSSLRFSASSAIARSSGEPPKFSSVIFSPDLTINGTTLLAGMTNAEKPGNPWWSASGTPLLTPVYDTNVHRAENHAGSGTNNVSFAFRLPPTAQDITVQYDLPQSVRSSSDGFWPTKMRDTVQRTEAQLFAGTSGTRVLTAAFAPSLTKATLRVGIASGAWKTAATDTHDTLLEPAEYMSTSTRDGNSHKFIFGRPIDISSVETKSNVVVTISTDTTDDLRVVAVTIQGQTVLPYQIGGNSIGTLDQITARFTGLPLSQIKEIRVETRPFQWMEFKAIALRPAK